MPGGAVQADGLQVLLHALVILDLSRDRDGHRLAAGAADELGRFAAWIHEEAKELMIVHKTCQNLNLPGVRLPRQLGGRV